MKKKIIALYLLIVVLFVSNISVVFGAGIANSIPKGLYVNFSVYSATEGLIKSGLIQAKVSLYDKNKKYIGSQTINYDNFDKEYGMFKFKFETTPRNNDKYYLKLESISDYLTPVQAHDKGDMYLNEFVEINIESFYGDPGSGIGLSLTGDYNNPIYLTSHFVQNVDELIVSTTVNGVPTKGVTFKVSSLMVSDQEATTDEFGLLRVPVFSYGLYSFILKDDQKGFVDANEMHHISKNDTSSTRNINLIRDIKYTNEILPSVSAKDEIGFNNFINVKNYSSSTFLDYSNNEWYVPYIEYAYKKGIISGKGNRSFDPKGRLTIAEAITLAGKVNKIYNGIDPSFKTSGSNWYDDAVNYAIGKGLIDRVEFDGRYNDFATRAEMVYIFSKALPKTAFDTIAENVNIPDVEVGNVYRDQIKIFYDSGIVNGSDATGTFNPFSFVTRAEAATIICKVANPLERKVRSPEEYIVINSDEVSIEEHEDFELKEVKSHNSEFFANVYIDGKKYLLSADGSKKSFDDGIINNFSEGLASVKVNGKYGFVNSNLDYVYEPQFDHCFNFSNGMAVIKLNGLYGYASLDPDKSITPRFDNASEFSEGLAVVVKDSKYGYIDKSGQYVIEPKYDLAYSFSDGLAAVAINGKIGYINKKGDLVIKPQFSFGSEFINGKAIVTVYNKEGIIDKNGNYIVELKFNDIRKFSEGLAVVNTNGSWNYINENGVLLTNSDFDSASDFSSGVAIVGKYHKIDKQYSEMHYGVINKSGEYVIEPQNMSIYDFNDGVAWFSVDSLYGLIDDKGNVIVKPKYKQVGSFANNLSPFFDGTKWGFIDVEGNIVIKPQFDAAYGFEPVE